MKSYEKPRIRVVSFDDKNPLMQDVIVKSGDTTGKVDFEHPIDPGTPVYVNHHNVWDEEI
jgi:hypothetical protein